VNVEVVAASVPYLIRGAVKTVAIAAAVIAIGTAAGVVVGLLRFTPWPRLAHAMAWAVELVRAVPLLLLILFIFFIFFGLPALGVKIPTFPAAVLALSFWMTVNTAEVVRGGIQSIPRGQFEAARSTGLSELQTMGHVIFPQAVRRMIPPFVGLCTILVKDTSLAAIIIGVFELTRAAQETIERTFRSFEIYLAAAAIYFVLCFPLTRLAQQAEARLRRS
jgi:His/Glu/Gln/Arg/opine family amino acid ABC transporter permease subunit